MPATAVATIEPQPVVETVVPTRAAPAASKPRTAAKPTRAAPAPKPVVRVPHDRGPVPLAAFVVERELDDALLAAAGGALLLVCAGGLVVLASGRRLLREGLA